MQNTFYVIYYALCFTNTVVDISNKIRQLKLVFVKILLLH